jgi:hypothetical protein
MFFSSTFGALAQTFAALVIFIAGYFALLLCAVVGIVIAHFLLKGARLSWPYLVAGYASTDAVRAKFAATARMAWSQVGILSHNIATARRSSL